MLEWTNPRKVGDNYYFKFKYQEQANKLSPLEAAQYTIEYITKNYPAPYTLYLSGGVDSQAMLYAWHKSGVPYTTFSAVYNQTLNEHDLCTLDEFASNHNITINYRDFDLISFLENEHHYYANEYYCGSPQITTFMKLADLTTDGTVIMSGQFIMSQFPTPKLGSLFVGIPDRNNFSLYNYGIKSSKNIVPFFFLETHELAYSFIKGFSNTNDTYTKKVIFYQSNEFPVIAQETKLNGFEQLKILYDTNPPRQPTIQERILKTSNQTSNRNFDLLYRNKYESQFSKHKYILL